MSDRVRQLLASYDSLPDTDKHAAVAEILRRAGVPASSVGPRPFGLCAGQFTVSDDFDAPLPDDILREFEGR
jgi:hypothetical protein